MERQMYLKINEYTNPGIKNKGVFGLVWHYTASPGASANNIARYFNGTCIASKRYASAHDTIDEKEVVNMIPYNLIAYHAHDRSRQYLDKNRYGTNANFTTLGIELCVDEAGLLHPDTYKRAVQHGAKLCKMFNLDPLEHNHRHYDVTEKNCPAFWVSNPAGFNKFKQDIKTAMEDKEPQPPVWNDLVLKPNQIGMLTIIKPINLWKRDENNKLEEVRVLQPGEKYRVYGYDDLYGGQFGLGAGLWVTKMEGYVEYSTPSKSKLEEAEKFYSK